MSVDAIKKFLSDAAAYPDGTMVKIGDTEVPLGSLRALNSSEREQLATAIKANEERATALKAEQNKVIDTANKAVQAYTAAEEMRARAASLATPTPAAADDWRADPWFKGLVKELDEEKKKRDTFEAAVKQLATIVNNAATIFSEDRWDRDYASLNFGKRDKVPSREDLLKFANENKIVDRHGLASIRLAWEKMSEGDRLKDAETAAFEKGRDAGRAEQLAARVPQPGVPGPGQPSVLPKSNGAAGELGDLYQEAIKDPELRALLEQSQGAGLGF